MDEITLQLNSPITDEQWDTIMDIDFDHTDRITFHTKHGKEVDFVKFKPIKTNADKYFRNATDEELAKIIVRAKYFDKFCEIVLAGENPGFCDDDCNECALDWLKQEVESDG